MYVCTSKSSSGSEADPEELLISRLRMVAMSVLTVSRFAFIALPFDRFEGFPCYRLGIGGSLEAGRRLDWRQCLPQAACGSGRTRVNRPLWEIRFPFRVPR